MTGLAGLLTGFFQAAYVTNDIDGARRDLGTRFAIERIIELQPRSRSKRCAQSGNMYTIAG